MRFLNLYTMIINKISTKSIHNFLLFMISFLYLGCVNSHSVSTEELIEKDTTNIFNAYRCYYLGVPQKDNLQTLQRNGNKSIQTSSFYKERWDNILYFKTTPRYYIDTQIDSYYNTSLVIPIDDKGTLGEYAGWFRFDSFQDTTYMVTCVFIDRFYSSYERDREMPKRYNSLAKAINEKMNKGYLKDFNVSGQEGCAWWQGKYKIELFYQDHFVGPIMDKHYEYEYIIKYIDKKREKLYLAAEKSRKQRILNEEQAKRDSMRQLEQEQLRKKIDAENHL